MLAIASIEIPVACALSQRYGLNSIWVDCAVAFLAMLGMQTACCRLVWKKMPICWLWRGCAVPWSALVFVVGGLECKDNQYTKMYT
ncbi:MAG: hypothetical protein WCH44_13870 [Betaproteobacteria bacterium]